LRDTQNFKAKAYRFFGKSIAEAKIELTDGVNEVPENEHGHFNHHPITGIDYHKKFNIISSFL
jgi:hypothetical protein